MGNTWRMIHSGLTVLRKPLIVRSGAIHFQLEPAKGCNLRCKFCQVPSYTSRTFMTAGQFRHIFDQIRPIKVALSGSGEPFLNKELLDIIRLAKRGGASALTTTNFTLCTKRLEEIVDSGLDLLKVSIDAATPQTYLRVRGGDFFDRIVTDLKALQEMKKRKASRSPFVRLQFVIEADNIEEVVPMIELAHDVQANAVYLQPLCTVEVSDKKDELVKGITKDRLRHHLQAAAQRAAQLGVSTNTGVLLKSLDQHYRKYQATIPETPPQRVCLLPWFSLYITVEGNVRPCCSFADTESLVMGNLFEDSFETIWNNEKYQTFRRQARERKLNYVICRACTPNRLRDFVRLSNMLPGFFSPKPAAMPEALS